ncbi:DUF1446 domain-containing protein [Ferrovibrio terrae]|uniref:DUF1446 domain-containing protein n=1 Tax=Ferrovibrio terrae TaxID=2594003 RepID=A0A516GXC2_9PROT|nr:acyclic terpene utilization AtuA family protein [Ferrovibrio terrae]QDO96142.1 DUF1446 domain-containing protein [Ferrovibrio terrae]
MPATTVHIGAGAGFAGDRPGAAVAVAEALAVASRQGIPAFLIFEMLAERTLALAQLDRRRDPATGYSANLTGLVQPVLKLCLQHNIRIIGNFGAANPQAAAHHLRVLAQDLGFRDAKIAVVTGDDLSARLTPADLTARETDGALLKDRKDIVAANAYLGAQPIAQALEAGADIVVTGRVADPALVLGPLAHAFGWSWDDWDRLAAGTLVGHLLECGPQVSGGYFADPGCKDAPDLDRLGYPIAEVQADGKAVITKPAGSGGVVDLRTVKEQVLYEIHDPAAYLTPDVILDLTEVELAQQGPDRVRVTGARGHARPATLKATVCFEAGWFAEAEISYAGPNATARARLAIDIIRKRMAVLQPDLSIRADIIGVVSSFGDSAGHDLAAATTEADDLRVRFATRHTDADVAKLLLAEVEALYVAGPAGGGGVRRHLVPQLASASCLIERDLVSPSVELAP